MAKKKAPTSEDNNKNNKIKAEETEDKDGKEEAKVEKEKSIYVKVSDDIREIIDKHKETGKTISSIIEEAIKIYDNFKAMSPEILAILDKYKEEFGSKMEEIEEALKVFDHQKDPQNAEDIDLWCRAREELQMMLIGKTTFNQLLTAAETPKESLDKPVKKNIAFDVILWYTGKPIRSLSLEEIISAIKRVWVVTNYFYFIDLKQEAEDQYYIVFKHHQNKRYSNYWLRYFKELFTSDDLSFKTLVEGESFDETLSLTIKKMHDKDFEELDVI